MTHTSDDKYDELLKKVQRDQVLSSDKKELGEQVYAIYKNTLEAFKPIYKQWNKFESYYKPGEGGKSLTRASHQTNTSQNVIFSNIEQAKPIIESALVKPSIYPSKPKDIEPAELLEKRVASAWKDSGLQLQKAPEVIHDVLVDGTAYIKAIYNGDKRNRQGDVTGILLNNRRVLFDPTGTLEESPYVLDVVLASVGETRQMFNKLSKQFEGGTTELEADQGKPTGPTVSNRSSGSFVSTTGSTSVAVGTASSKDVFVKADKIIRIECWYWDMTINDNGELKYPYGRLVTVCVGADKDGHAKEDRDAGIDIEVVMDEENPYTILAQYTGRFPFYEIQCHNSKDTWGIGEVDNQVNSQDLLNDAINTTHDNWKLNNNPIKVGLKKYGISGSTFKNKPGEVILIDAPDAEDARRAFTTVAPPLIAQYTLPFVNLYTQLNERDSGVADATRGVRPSGVTSGRAIDSLADRADNKFLLIARAINNAFILVYQAMAYIAQEFDEASEEGFFLDNEDANPLMATAEERFTNYDPTKTADIMFKVEGVRQSGIAEIIPLLEAVSKLDQTIPGMGMIALKNFGNKRILYLYEKVLEEAKQAAQQAQQAQADAQNAQLTQDLLSKNNKTQE